MADIIKESFFLDSFEIKEDEKMKNEIITLFVKFLNSGFSRDKFDKKLYSYLCLHGGFTLSLKQEDFYNVFFSLLITSEATKKEDKWVHITTDFFLNEKGYSFSEVLFSSWNSYGYYSDLNLVLQNIYRSFTEELAIYLKNSNVISQYNRSIQGGCS